jgi:phosphinothricin acetyltransferase
MFPTTIRAADLADLPKLTEIHNYYVLHSHITFDVRPFSPEDRFSWFHEHSDGRRYRLLVAESGNGAVVGYATTGRFRSKPAYDTTVEVSIACVPDVTGKGIGAQLYEALFQTIEGEDINLLVAGVAQPNPASNALHRRFGFQPVGTFSGVGRKFGKYWDVTWFERRSKL